MIIGSIKEQNKFETRCALTPNVVKKLSQLGHKILLQEDIGLNSYFKRLIIANNAFLKLPLPLSASFSISSIESKLTR